MEISHALKIPRNGAEPAQSDSFIDLDLLLEETYASVREDVRKIKQSERDHTSSAQHGKNKQYQRDFISSAQGEKNKQSKKDCISSAQGDKNRQSKMDCISSVQGKKNEQSKRGCVSSAQDKKTKQSIRDCTSSAQDKKNNQSKRDCISSVQDKKNKESKRGRSSSAQGKEKDATKLKIEGRNTDRNEFGSDPLSKSEGVKVASEISEEEKRWLHQQYLALKAASRRLAFMKGLCDMIIEVLKEKTAFKN